MAKRHHRTTKRLSCVTINRVRIPVEVINSVLVTQRDTILERDETYRMNTLALIERKRQGKVDESAFRSIQQSLQMSALRRAHINLRDSERMLQAV